MRHYRSPFLLLIVLTSWQLQMVVVVEKVAASGCDADEERRNLPQQEGPPDGPVGTEKCVYNAVLRAHGCFAGVL